MTTIIYLPGLGGRWSILAQRILLFIHKRPGRRIITFQPKWHEQESYTAKYARFEHFIKSKGGNIVLYAASAGGPLAIASLAQLPQIERATIVCGKLSGSATIGQPFRDRAPALYDAVKKSEQLIAQKSSIISKKITILQPIHDGVVPLNDMLVPGAVTKTLPAHSHATAIVLALFRHFP